MTTEPTVHVLCGLPAAGKTTYAVQLSSAVRGVRFSLDEWMLELFELRYDDDRYVERLPHCKELIKAIADQVLALGHDVVLDWNHWSGQSRAEAADWARSRGAEVRVHFVDVPVALAVERAPARATSGNVASHVLDEAAVRHATTYFEPPTEDEGIRVVHTSPSSE